MAYTERLSFGTARFASTIFAAYAAYYLMGFCTDAALIPPAATAAILFGLRIFDIVNDQFAGVFINRKHFKDGKYRPYLKWCSVPFALTFLLLGWMPDFSLPLRIIYFTLMAASCELIATFLNTAELSMLPYLAKDDTGRVKFMSFSNIGAILAYFIIGSFMLPLVNFFGKDQKTGYLLVMGIFACLSIPAHLWAYWGLKERQNIITAKLVSIRQMLLIIVKNRRLLLFLAGYCLYYMADTLRSQTAYYYMTYNLGRQDFLPVILMTSLLGCLFIQPFIPQLLKLASKEILMIFGLIAAGAASMLILAAGERLYLLVIFQLFYGISTAITANLVFTVVASFNDEILEQKKIPMSEILIAIMALSANFGAAISGGIAPLVLAVTGYSATASVQNVSALEGIKTLYIYSAAAGMVLACVFMLLFRSQKK